MLLSTLDRGQAARIRRTGGQGAFRRRLLELGLLPGTRIERTGEAPFGDPLTFRVRGAVLALRRAEAATIEVEPEEGVVPAAAK